MTTWLAIGDSLTVGTVGSAVGDAADVALTDGVGYRRLVATALGRIPVGPYVTGGLAHGAIGGASTHTYLSELDPATIVPFVHGPPHLTWMQFYKPSVVSIMLGTNDFNATPHEDPENVVSRIGILVTAANELYSGVERYELLSIFANTPRTRAFNAALYARVVDPAHFGAVRGRIFYVDASRKANAVLATDPAAVTAAGHWNARGYRDVGDGYVEGVLTGGVTDPEIPHPHGPTPAGGPPGPPAAGPSPLARGALALGVGVAAVWAMNRFWPRPPSLADRIAAHRRAEADRQFAETEAFVRRHDARNAHRGPRSPDAAVGHAYLGTTRRRV